MRSKPIIEDVLDKIRCPQFGYNDYGRWGILTFNQRLEIKELCDYAKTLEKCYEDYKSKCEKAIEYIEKCQLGVDGMDRPYMLLDQEEGRDLLKILGGD